MYGKGLHEKPVEIRAVCYDGGNVAEIKAFAGDSCDILDSQPIIHTLEGDKTAKTGDYVICGVKGEFYPCSPESFDRGYEHVKNEVYRKKASATVTAVQFTGDNFPEIAEFTSFDPARTAVGYEAETGTCKIPHPGNADYTCHTGDYVIRNGGSVYPCEPEIFGKTYDPAD